MTVPIPIRSLPRSFDARLPDDGSIAAARRRPDIWAEAAALPYRYWPESHHAQTRRETTEEKARRILLEELDKAGWRAADLEARPKGDRRKVRMARRLRTETSVTLKWISQHLHMGTWSHVASRLYHAKMSIESDGQNEFKLQ